MKNRTSFLLAGLTVLLFFAYFSIHQHFPDYFQWDMDWISTLDSLLVQSGTFPDHVNHTGFGMYLIFLWTQKIAHWAGLVSFLNLADVSQSGNPLLGAAEAIHFFRLQSVFLAITVVWILFWSLRNLGTRFKSNLNLPLLFLFFLTFGVLDSLFYHSAMIRTEFYSVFFLVLAFACGVRALKGPEVSRFVWVGLFLGLSYLTKLQSFFLLFWLPLLLVLISKMEGRVSLRLEILRGRRFTGMALVLPAVFFGFLRSSQGYELPAGLATFTSVYKMNSVAVVFIGIFLTPLLLGLFSRKRSKVLEMLLVGFLLSFLAHFLVYSSWASGWDYLRIDLKMLFFRSNYQSVNGLGLMSALRHLQEEFTFAPGFYGVHFLVFTFALISAQGKRRLILLLEGLLLVSIAIGTRSILRDLLWREVPLVLWDSVLLLWLLSRGWGFRGLVYLLLLMHLWVQGDAALKMQGRLDAHYITYGWEPSRWLDGVYEGRHLLYTKLVNEKITPTNRDLAVKQVLQWQEYRKALQSSFVNLIVDFRDVSTLASGFHFPHSKTEVLGFVPPSLKGALMVVPISSPRPHSLIAKLVKDGGEEEQKFKSGSRSQVALLARPDTEFYFFIPKGVSLGKNEGLDVTSLTLTTDNQPNPKEFIGHRISKYAEIPSDLLKAGGFFVVHLRNS